MIVWPMQSVTKNPKEIQMLHEMAERQKTKKIIYLTIKEPWYSPEPLKPYVDRIVTLDCEMIIRRNISESWPPTKKTIYIKSRETDSINLDMQ